VQFSSGEEDGIICRMKLIAYLLVVATLVGFPLYALDALLMPQLKQLQYSYAHADEIAAREAGVPVAANK
jgi:hypothetical protein